MSSDTPLNQTTDLIPHDEWDSDQTPNAETLALWFLLYRLINRVSDLEDELEVLRDDHDEWELGHKLFHRIHDDDWNENIPRYRP